MTDHEQGNDWEFTSQIVQYIWKDNEGDQRAQKTCIVLPEPWSQSYWGSDVPQYVFFSEPWSQSYWGSEVLGSLLRAMISVFSEPIEDLYWEILNILWDKQSISISHACDWKPHIWMSWNNFTCLAENYNYSLALFMQKGYTFIIICWRMNHFDQFFIVFNQYISKILQPNYWIVCIYPLGSSKSINTFCPGHSLGKNTIQCNNLWG